MGFKKRVLAAAIGLVMAAAVPAVSASAASGVAKASVKIDGRAAVKTDALTKSDIRLVTLDFVGETAGASVNYDKIKGEMTIETAAHKLVLKNGKTDFTIDGQAKKLDAAPTVVSNVAYVPLASVFRALGATVDYEKDGASTIEYFSRIGQATVKIDGSTTVQPIATLAADKLNALNKGLAISVAGGGSGAGVNNTIAGTNNLGMSSRALTDDEATKINAITIANDAIAIIVHPDNKVKNLTKAQAEKIFKGEITNWKDVGGANAPIKVMTRETGSGTRASLEEMLLEKKSIVGTATPFTSSALIKQAVARDKNAIGFDSIGFVDKTVKAISLNSVAPNAETAKSGDYLLARSLYILVKGQPAGASALFVDYLRTKACQDEIVVKEGYISIY